MNLSDKVYQKAKTASSADELMRFAAEEGMSLGKDEAEKYFSFLHSSGKLSDEEAEAITGGKGEPKPKYSVGQHVEYPENGIMNYGTITGMKFVDLQGAFYYTVQFDGFTRKLPLESNICPGRVI